MTQPTLKLVIRKRYCIGNSEKIQIHIQKEKLRKYCQLLDFGKVILKLALAE